MYCNVCKFVKCQVMCFKHYNFYKGLQASMVDCILHWLLLRIESQIHNLFQESQLEGLDAWIASRLSHMVTKCDGGFQHLSLNQTTEAIYNFFWLEFCDVYLVMLLLCFVMFILYMLSTATIGNLFHILNSGKICFVRFFTLPGLFTQQTIVMSQMAKMM